MSIPTQEIIQLSELLKKPLIIPEYQRPYKWSSEHVVRLLEDIFEYVIAKDKIYRIGSIIVHNDQCSLNIVDGQQRLTTISILLKLLGMENFPLLNQEYKHKISKDHIAYNARIIRSWLDSKINKESRDSFKNKLLDKCKFVLFTVFEPDEAFQLFDSQNARGKTLEPYDLLKAFHLREMQFDTENDRATCVERWEKSIDKKTLKPILDNHLFKIRKWTKNEWKYDFTKEDIDEFKGISLHQKQAYPFESALRILDGFVENAENDKVLKSINIPQSYPFSITMPIINGKRFFEYVDFYIQIKENMLSENKNGRLNEFYKKQCINYYGSFRSGDEKVRNLYENILLLFIDKFGYTDDFQNFYKAFYKATYIIRCNNRSIRLETILNSESKSILKEINDSAVLDKLKRYQFRTYKITTTNFVKGIEIITNFIDESN